MDVLHVSSQIYTKVIHREMPKLGIPDWVKNASSSLTGSKIPGAKKEAVEATKGAIESGATPISKSAEEDARREQAKAKEEKLARIAESQALRLQLEEEAKAFEAKVAGGDAAEAEAKLQQQKKDAEAEREKAEKKAVVKVEPSKTFTADISGMTCEMGCGGSIRTKLKGTGAVSRVQFDFVEGRKTQGMTVFFDGSKITQKQLMDILLTMNEQQFTLANTTVQTLEK
jgi:copper chaperone CopZ